MATSKTKTAEQKERDRDKRYRKAYHIGLDTYNRIGEAQGWRCGACGRPQSDFTVSLNIDHEHFHIKIERVDNPTILALNLKWVASTTLSNGKMFVKFAKTQSRAIANLKAEATPHSIRGLLCPGRYTGCNRLMGRIDHIDWLEKVLVYLKNPPARQIIT